MRSLSSPKLLVLALATVLGVLAACSTESPPITAGAGTPSFNLPDPSRTQH